MTGGNYAAIVADNIRTLFENLPEDLQGRLAADRQGDRFFFSAFGRPCSLSPEGIFLDKDPQSGALGILISLYALHACPDPCRIEPLKGFKDLPDAMPYAGAFVTHTENLLVPSVEIIAEKQEEIKEVFSGKHAPGNVGGDFSFLLFPLPKIALCYIFYRADADFPASATCLFSNNAQTFLSTDALADVGEYTSRKILQRIAR
jgi:hypothetical protein